jgi:hypothetical protein
MIVGLMNICSAATSYTFFRSWGTSRSITPTPGKSMYRHVTNSIISSVVRATRPKRTPPPPRLGEDLELLLLERVSAPPQ